MVDDNCLNMKYRKRRLTMAEELTLEKFEEAYNIIKKVVLPTKLVESEYYSNLTGNKVFFKPENMQLTGAYKIRGAYYKISTLTDEERQKGLITASAGNHAQGVAYAAKAYGVKATIVMPSSTPLIKVNRTKSYGAEVILYGDVYDESCAYALELAEDKGYTFIHPFDDLDVATGQGSVAMEIIKELPFVDYILVPIGGGGLASGIGSFYKQMSPKTKIIGVEPAGAAGMKKSFECGEVTELNEVDKFVDGAAVQRVGELTYAICKKVLDDIVVVPEGKICTTILNLYNFDAIVVEPAGALSMSALDFYKNEIKGKNVVCVVSGSNNDITRMEDIKERSLLYEGLKHYFVVRFPQRAGALQSFVSNVLGPHDDITYFEYKKKTNREKGPALIGIEIQHPEDFQGLLDRMKSEGILYEYLNDNPNLFEFLIG